MSELIGVFQGMAGPATGMALLAGWRHLRRHRALHLARTSQAGPPVTATKPSDVSWPERYDPNRHPGRPCTVMCAEWGCNDWTGGYPPGWVACSGAGRVGRLPLKIKHA